MKHYAVRDEIDRILKGYKPRSDKIVYSLLYDFMTIVAVIKLKIFRCMKGR